MYTEAMYVFNFEEISSDVVVACLVLSCYYHAVRRVVGTSEKRTSWILTMCCAIILSVAGLPVTLDVCRSGKKHIQILYAPHV
jgi:hypothetical protein